MGVALERTKVIPMIDRQKRVTQQSLLDESIDKIKSLTERQKILLAEIANYEKQNFDEWPQGRDFLAEVQKELWNINARLKKNS